MENERKGRQLRSELELLRGASSKIDGTEDGAHSENETAKPQSIKNLLVWSLLDQYAIKDFDNRKEWMREIFGHLDVGDAGITAPDLVSLIKTSTGITVDLETAQEFIDKYDLDENQGLDIEEALRLFSTEPRRTERKTENNNES